MLVTWIIHSRKLIFKTQLDKSRQALKNPSTKRQCNLVPILKGSQRKTTIWASETKTREIERCYHGFCFMVKTNLSWFLFSRFSFVCVVSTTAKAKKEENEKRASNASCFRFHFARNFFVFAPHLRKGSRFVGTAITLHLAEIGYVRVNAVKNQFYNRKSFSEWFSQTDNALASALSRMSVAEGGAAGFVYDW